jgi:D-alanyl-D-alanine carboxypeptidase/D-alanyl-D-alanine-endopeptidase (penicillin-binding protein 4)
MKFIAACLLLSSSVLLAAEAQLPVGVQRALQVRQIPADTLSVFVADVETGETILEWRGDEPRNPASTMKLLTTLVALDRLGPAYRWRTDVFAAGEIKDGRLDGDLVLKGYGDPFLVTERVWQLLKNIRNKGVRDITGDLLLDDSWFDVGDYDPGAFDQQPLRAYNVAPNALLMNFKVVRYRFQPDPLSNSVNVTLDPSLENLNVDNRLRLAQRSCGGFQRGITVSSNTPMDEVTFSGRFPSGCKRYAMDRTVLSHNAFVHGLFSSLWRESGGAFEGEWRKVEVVGDDEPLLSFRSLPLSDVITSVNKHSNNVMARQLLFTLGAEVNGAPGTQDGGKAVIQQWLADKALLSGDIVIENGAGLSRDTRITANDMGALLKFAWRQAYMPEFLGSLSLSGLDGTLRRRFKNSGLVGQAHLKTGSLDHVTAIAGYLQSRSGRRFAIAVLQNHEDIHRGPGEEVQEAVLRWLYEQ